MKQKKLFLTGFISIVIISTLVILGLYKNVEANAKYDKYALGYRTVEAMSYLMIDKCDEFNKDYEPIKFYGSPDKISKDSLKIVTDTIKSRASLYVNLLENDENFGYEIQYKDQTYSFNMPKQVDNNKALYYHEISFSKNGIQTSSSLLDDAFSSIDDNIIVDINEETYSVFNEDGIPTTTQIHINAPKDISFKFYIPKNLKSNQKIIVTSLAFPDNFMFFSLFSMIIVCAIIALYIFIFPFQYEILIPTLARSIRLKLEWALIIYSCLISLVTTGCLEITGNTLNHAFERWLIQYKIPEPQIIIFGSNFIIYAILFTATGLIALYIKNAVKLGFIKFIKTNTVTYSILHTIKSWFDKFISIDLSNGANKKLVILTCINTSICIILIFLGPIGFIGSIIYGIISFVILKHKFEKIQNEYLNVLEHSMALAKGDFDNEYNENIKTFNSLEYELSRIQVGFESALKERIKSQNLKTELITNVSHDLKTPLTGIKNYLELLDDENLDSSTRKEYLNILQNYSNRLNNLVTDLFEVSKANSGNIELHLQEINLIEFIEQIHAENAQSLEEKHLTLVLQTNDKDIHCVLDPNRSVRIFENLINNIVKYALENTRVFIDIIKDKNNVTISYKNISKTYLDFDPKEIQERFVRGDASRHETGSGLGLAIIKSFVEIQSGQFDIEIDGDVFKAIVTLPIK